MKNEVKKIVSNWIIATDKAYPPEKMSVEQKNERLHGIKTVINFLNRLDNDGLLNKMTIIYPTTHPVKELRSVPIKFN